MPKDPWNFVGVTLLLFFLLKKKREIWFFSMKNTEIGLTSYKLILKNCDV